MIDEWVICPHHHVKFPDRLFGGGFVAVRSAPYGFMEFPTMEEAILFLEAGGFRYRISDFEIDISNFYLTGRICPWVLSGDGEVS